MKFGFRTPNLEKSIKARTTGRFNRAVKKAVNPVYGKKGIGYVNDPKRAVYNNIYKKTTVGVSDIAKPKIPNSKKDCKIEEEKYIEETVKYKNYEIIDNKIFFNNKLYTKEQFKKLGKTTVTASVLLIILGLCTIPIGIIFLVLGIIYLKTGKREIKEAEEMK